MKDQNGKKIVLLLYCALCITVCTASASVIRIDSQSGSVGDRVTFTVSAADVSDTVQSLGFEVVYDARVLQFQGFSPGSLTQNFTHFSANNTDFGTVRIGGFDAGDNPILQGASGELIRLEFEVAEGKNSALQIRNLLDDVKGWTAGEGSFSGIAEEEEDVEDADETAGTTENAESGETEGNSDNVVNSSEPADFPEKQDAPSPVSRPEIFPEPTDSKGENTIAETGTREESILQMQSGTKMAKEEHNMMRSPETGIIKTEPVRDTEKEKPSAVSDSQRDSPSVPESNKISAEQERGDIWQWVMCALLLLILIIQAEILRQVRKNGKSVSPAGVKK